MLRRWLLHDLYGVSIDNDTKSLEGACGIAQSGVRRGNNHQRWRIGRIEHRAQCISAASGGGNRIARRHRQWGIDNRILRDTARATEIRLKERLGFRRLFFKCDDTLQFVGCAGEQCLQRLCATITQNVVETDHDNGTQGIEVECGGDTQFEQLSGRTDNDRNRTGGNDPTCASDGADRHHAQRIVGEQYSGLLCRAQRLFSGWCDDHARGRGAILFSPTALQSWTHRRRHHPQIGWPLQHYMLAARCPGPRGLPFLLAHVPLPFSCLSARPPNGRCCRTTTSLCDAWRAPHGDA